MHWRHAPNVICPDSNLHTKTIQEEYDNQNNMMMDDLLTDTTNIIDTNVKEENALVFLNVHLFFSSDFFLKLDGLSLGAEPLTIHLIYTSWTENANFKNLSQNRANRANCKLGYSWIKYLFHIFLYRVLFLTVPPNFQYQNEKRWAANQRFCSMEFSMYKRS